ALAYIREKGAPIVVKADGLAAGKGVIVAMTQQEAEEAAKDLLAGNACGAAGHRVVIEEFPAGEAASFIAMVDGKHVLPLATRPAARRTAKASSWPCPSKKRKRRSRICWPAMPLVPPAIGW